MELFFIPIKESNLKTFDKIVRNFISGLKSGGERGKQKENRETNKEEDNKRKIQGKAKKRKSRKERMTIRQKVISEGTHSEKSILPSIFQNSKTKQKFSKLSTRQE